MQHLSVTRSLQSQQHKAPFLKAATDTKYVYRSLWITLSFWFSGHLRTFTHNQWIPKFPYSLCRYIHKLVILVDLKSYYFYSLLRMYIRTLFMEDVQNIVTDGYLTFPSSFLSRIFSGFKYLWIMPLECRNWIPPAECKQRSSNTTEWAAVVCTNQAHDWHKWRLPLHEHILFALYCALSHTFTCHFQSYWLQECCIMGVHGAGLIFISVCVCVC